MRILTTIFDDDKDDDDCIIYVDNMHKHIAIFLLSCSELLARTGKFSTA
jgi:hypothetical protein